MEIFCYLGVEMKNYYKINEIAQLYGISTDSLRYYERLGILHPRRDTNGYRLYDLKDMYKLTVIRDLRQLDFPMAKIKDYLEAQCVDHTLSMLQQEQQLLEEKMEEIRRRQKLLAERIDSLETALGAKPGKIELKTMPDRKCVCLNQHITRDEEMDFVIKKLQRAHEDQIKELGNQIIGAFFSMDHIRRGIANVYHSVFIVLEEDSVNYDFILPEGIYASCFYKGSYKQNGDQVNRMLGKLAGQGLSTSEEPFEIYEIDNRDTVKEEEFMTEIQVLVTAGA